MKIPNCFISDLCVCDTNVRRRNIIWISTLCAVQYEIRRWRRLGRVSIWNVLNKYKSVRRWLDRRFIMYTVHCVHICIFVFIVCRKMGKRRSVCVVTMTFLWYVFLRRIRSINISWLKKEKNTSRLGGGGGKVKTLTATSLKDVWVS